MAPPTMVAPTIASVVKFVERLLIVVLIGTRRTRESSSGYRKRENFGKWLESRDRATNLHLSGSLGVDHKPS